MIALSYAAQLLTLTASMPEVTVAIPVRDGGALFAELLRALSSQTVEHELVICDSGSRDGSLALAHDTARACSRSRRSASRTAARATCCWKRARRPRGAAHPGRRAGRRALAGAAAGGLRAGGGRGARLRPLPARAEASPAVRIELESWFASLSPDGSPQVERLDEHERAIPAVELIGGAAFSPTPMPVSRARLGSGSRSARSPTPRTGCWRIDEGGRRLEFLPGGEPEATGSAGMVTNIARDEPDPMTEPPPGHDPARPGARSHGSRLRAALTIACGLGAWAVDPASGYDYDEVTRAHSAWLASRGLRPYNDF